MSGTTICANGVFAGLDSSGSDGFTQARTRRCGGFTPARTRGRGGFTLVELIVAIMILSVGVLGLASTAAVVTRQMGGGAQQTRAAAVAQTRFEEMRAMACADYGGLPYHGTAEGGGFREAWAVVDFPGINAAAPARALIDSVFYDANGKEQVRVFRSIRTC